MVTYKVSLTLLFETKEEKIFTDGKGSLVTVKRDITVEANFTAFGIEYRLGRKERRST